MIKPRILTLIMVLTIMGCKEISSSSERPDETDNSNPTHSAPETKKRDTLHLSPAQRELRKKEYEARKKGLDTLKPVTA